MKRGGKGKTERGRERTRLKMSIYSARRSK